MKFTIMGFNQREAINLNLSTDELLLLRFFVDFKESGAMTTKENEGKTYYWVNYSYVLENLPILGNISKRTLMRKFDNLVDNNVLEKYTHKSGGTFSCYKTGVNYIKLISESSGQNCHTVCQICHTPMTDLSHPVCQNCHNKDSSIKDTSIKYNTPSSSNEKSSTDNQLEIMENLWKLYPVKKGKATAIKKIPKLLKKYGEEQLTRCVNRFIMDMKSEKRDIKYYMQGSTFFNSGYMDYLDENYNQDITTVKEKENKTITGLTRRDF